MYGFKVPKSNICVDYWDDEKEPHIRFLTHAQDNRLHNISNVKDRIYMSPFSLWYLKHVRKVNLKEHVYCLTLDKRHEIIGRDESGENKVFHVTLINANHCAGSVMYFFEGDFGQVLCTGDFRYTQKMFSNPILYLLKKTKSLDILNFDNRYVAEHCTFPPNEVVVKNTVDMLKSFPEHKIMICIGEWGKLDLLQAIAKELKEKISVSKTCMMIAKRFGITDIFTLEESRISTHDSDLLSLKDLHELQSKMGPTILLVMNAFYFTSVEFSEKAIKECQDQGLHIMPYSEHSNHQELREFISALQPNFIVPVVRPSLGTSLLPAVARNSTIPESILVLQKSYRTGLSQDSVQEDSPGPALSDLLEGFGFRGFDLKEGEGPASKKKKTMCHTEEIDYPTCKLCGANGGKVEKTDRKYPKILNYWTDQSVNGNAFRHPDLEGVYDYK